MTKKIKNDYNKINKVSPPPFSLRLTFEERAKLEKAANGVSLGAYIKAVLFGQDLQKVRRRNTNPIKDHAALAKVLGVLGQSRLAQNINQMAANGFLADLPDSAQCYVGAFAGEPNFSRASGLGEASCVEVCT